MKSSKVIPLVVAVGLLSILPSATHAQLAVSTFGTDADGWVVADRSELDLHFIGTRPVIHITPGGNPGGFLQASDTTTNWWYWRAPAKFLGDKSIAYGGSLSFDLISDMEIGHDSCGAHPVIGDNARESSRNVRSPSRDRRCAAKIPRANDRVVAN